MTRQIAVVTGTRSEFGLLRSSMAAIRDHADLDLQVIATGMHLSPQHGYTVEEVEGDGFDVDSTVHMLLEGDSGLSMAKSLGIGISGLAEAFGDDRPDVVLVLGDRDEALAAGLAAAHMNIPVAHVHGGDAMQGAIIDDSIRHALTKFAHLHFPATETSASRIEKLGEEPWRIRVVGAPGIDAVIHDRYAEPETVRDELCLPENERIVLVVQHPVTTQPERAGDQMRATLEAVTELDAEIILIYPNSDAGGKAMIEVIETYRDRDRFHLFENVPRHLYLGLLEIATVVVGNSSSGIIEAPSFGLPVVDVGPRQESRERAGNVLSVPHESSEIREALVRCLEDETFRHRLVDCDNPYDHGGAANLIVDRLHSVNLDKDLLRKRLTYEP